MEKAQYLQERSLPELKDFLERGIFSKDEIKHIVKRRQVFESALIRRVARKSDFLKYVEYEMSLESLRRKRIERLKIKGPTSISDYALTRKQFFIMERAVRKFKSDLGLWVQYIQLAKREGARSLAGRLCARALQLHPTSPALYILSSSHEIEQLSPSAARGLLQRGLRMNPESVELWTEYVKMELSYVESLRRRWEVLGIAPKESAEGKGKGKQEQKQEEGVDTSDVMMLDEEGQQPPITTPSATEKEPEEDESEASRREVMSGAIVRAVMENAVKELPTIPLFTSLQTLLTTFPSPLRPSLIDTLHEHLGRAMPTNPEARLLHATRRLTPDLLEGKGKGAELVERLKEANEELLDAAKDESVPTAVCDIYSRWVEEWTGKVKEDNLRQYLILSLQGLPTKLPKKRVTASLLATCLSLFISSSNPLPPSGDKILRAARKYTSETYLPASRFAVVWFARLEIEKRYSSSSEEVKKCWAEARKQATEGTREEVEGVWLWGVHGDIPAMESDPRATYDELLRTSMEHQLGGLHDAVLIDYVSTCHPEVEAHARRKDLVRVFGAYRPSQAFYSRLFACEAGMEGNGVKDVLEMIYERWRGVSGEEEEAGITWGTWLLRRGDGEAAGKVMRRTFSAAASPESRERLERRWGEVLGEENNEGLAG